jgi:hypothetical protein
MEKVNGSFDNRRLPVLVATQTGSRLSENEAPVILRVWVTTWHCSTRPGADDTQQGGQVTYQATIKFLQDRRALIDAALTSLVQLSTTETTTPYRVVSATTHTTPTRTRKKFSAQTIARMRAAQLRRWNGEKTGAARTAGRK